MIHKHILAIVGLFGLVAGEVAYGQADLLPSIPKGTIAVNLETVVSGLGAPVYAINAPDDPDRLFIVDQKGQISILQNRSLLPTPFLDIQSRVTPPFNPAAGDERGLLGLAFHPEYNNPVSSGFRTLYTYGSEVIPSGGSPTFAVPNSAPQNYMNVVNEWKVSANNPNAIDMSSRREIFSIGKNAGNHNGGTIAFGNDGYLYLGTGDGGNGNDVGVGHLGPSGNAQSLATPLGKMLRIDPLSPNLNPSSTNPISQNGQYRIPVDNPYQAAGQVREIYAYGFRNPYRFSFDRDTGQLIAADVGQGNVEEINRVEIGGNYGWAVKEGDFLFNRTTGPGGNAGTVGARSPGQPNGLIDPITGPAGTLEYDHQDGVSITGGFVYRGNLIPELEGKYIFGDLIHPGPVSGGRLFYADLTGGQMSEFILPQFTEGVLPDGLALYGFGQDFNGELYALATNSTANGTGGRVFAITSISAVPEPASLALTLVVGGIGCFYVASRKRRANKS